MIAAQLAIPDIPWQALSPELVLFGAGLVALLLDTADDHRVRVSFLIMAATVGGAGYAHWGAGAEVFGPALLATGGVLQLLLTMLWQQRPRVLAAIIAVLGFSGCLAMTGWQWFERGGDVVVTSSLLGDMVAVDGVALFTRVTVCLAGLLTIPLGFAYADARRIHRGEYYPLILFAATGMTLLASAADLIMVFIAVEVLSLALYVLTGFAKRDPLAQEAGLKYFVLGAFSSALLLYGIALVYGATGTTNLAAAGELLRAAGDVDGLIIAAFVLLAVGFAFKTALVPFHMWTPDVYQGAPTPITGFMAAATKAAAFAAFIRVFAGAFGPQAWSWEPVLWVLGAVTMIVGAVLAIVQTDLKRMLAYSAVAHAGYALIGLVANTPAGVSATLFYLLTYSFMSVGSFGVLAVIEQRTKRALTVDDLKGIGQRQPVLAAMFALFLLSLAGIPGTAGFIGKFVVFQAGVAAGHVPLVVVAIVSSVIAAFFYIRVIVAMFMEEASDTGVIPADLRLTVGGTTGLAGATAGVIVLGILPGALLDFAAQAASLAG